MLHIISILKSLQATITNKGDIHILAGSLIVATVVGMSILTTTIYAAGNTQVLIHQQDMQASTVVQVDSSDDKAQDYGDLNDDGAVQTIHPTVIYAETNTNDSAAPDYGDTNDDGSVQIILPHLLIAEVSPDDKKADDYGDTNDDGSHQAIKQSSNQSYSLSNLISYLTIHLDTSRSVQIV